MSETTPPSFNVAKPLGICLAGLIGLLVIVSVMRSNSQAVDSQSGEREEAPISNDRTILLRSDQKLPEALARAVKAINQGEVDVLRFTPGEFHMPSGLKLKRSMGQNGLAIIGAGPGVTKLVFTDVENALEVSLDTDIRDTPGSPSFRLKGLSLIAQGKCGNAVKLMRGSPDRQGGTSAKVLSDLTIDGLKGGGWSGGVVCSDLAFCTFDDITLRLPLPGALGIHITGSTAPVDHHVRGIRVLSADTAIKVSGNVEGVYMDQLTLIGVEVGIDWDTSGHEPLLALSGSHISAREACVRANNLLQPVITGNLLYQAGSDHRWTGIEIITKRSTAYDLLQISQNTLHGNPNHKQPTTGISIEAASAGAVHSNVFSAVDTGIRLGAKAKGLEPANNVFSKTGKPLHRGARD